MALLDTESFDHYGTSVSNMTGNWSSNVQGALSTSNPRTGTHAYRSNNSFTGTITSKTYTTSGGAVIGFAYYPTQLSSLALCQVLEGSTVHFRLVSDASGNLIVQRNTTTLATSTSPVLSADSYYYIEVKVTIDDSSGTTEVHVDGVAVDGLTLTGQDTKNGGTGVWDNVKFSVFSGDDLDDIYICDTSGSAPRNDFLGPVKIECLFAQTDATAAGTNADLTPSTGSDHGALVDETSPNTSDYNSSATVGHKDTYNFTDLALTGTILGIKTNLWVAKTDAAARTVCPVVRTGGADFDGDDVAPLTSYSNFGQVWEQNPDTTDEWSAVEVDGLEAGMKVTA